MTKSLGASLVHDSKLATDSHRDHTLAQGANALTAQVVLLVGSLFQLSAGLDHRHKKHQNL